MLDAALQYAGRGWPVFPLTGYKTPLKGSHGFKDASTDEGRIRQWWPPPAAGRRTHNIGLATGFHPPTADKTGLPAAGGANLLVLDADGPGGLAELTRLAAGYGGLPKTLTAQTSKGFHFYYALPADVRLRSSNAKRAVRGGDGVDIRADGGYTVLPPSVNRKTGFVYRWALDIPVAPAPAWLIAWCQERIGNRRGETKASPRRVQPSTFGERPGYLGGRTTAEGGRVDACENLTTRALRAERQAELPELLAALRKIPASLQYYEWFKVGAAIYDYDPSADGLAIFKAWSWSDPGHRTDLDVVTCEKKWVEYQKNEDLPADRRVTKASIYMWAADKKAEEDTVKPESFVASNADSSRAVPSEVGNNVPGDAPFAQQSNPFAGGNGGAHGVGMNGHSFKEAGGSPFGPAGDAASGGFGTGTLENPLIELNNKYAVIGDVGSKCLVLSFVPSKVDETLRVPSFQAFKSFSERYANRYVTVQHRDDHGAVKEEVKQLGGHWLKWPKRRSFEGIDLIPGGPAVLPGNVLNLWSGFAVQPSPAAGGWEKMKWHITNILASGDADAATYIFKFAAWCVQHPGERAEVALVFKGGKGSGKGTFANALKRIFGQHGLQIFNSKHLVGAFNGHLRNCLMLFADEAFWAGDKAGESTLKGMLTEPALMIEQKGVDAAPWRNRLKVIMAANADWVVPASHDERRYAMFDVSGEKIGDRAYFKALHFELLTGGMACMLHDLLKMDLGEWHPREVIHNTALQKQKMQSLGPLAAWWEQVLQRGVIPGHGVLNDVITAKDALESALEACGNRREVNGTSVGRYLAAIGCNRSHTSVGNEWSVLNLAILRKNWENKYGKWKWELELKNWRNADKRVKP